VITTKGQLAQINPARLATVIGLDSGGHSGDLFVGANKEGSLDARKIKNKKSVHHGSDCLCV